MSLSHEDIQAILKVLDESPYNELQLETDRFSLYLQRGDEGGWSQETTTLTEATKLSTEKPAGEKPAAQSQNVDQTQEPEAGELGLVDVRAPMVGTFYRSPKPGAAPFVEIGSRVEDNTVIAIIEVMKLMNSIPAAVSGEVREILIDDAQFVEKGQLVMRVRPD